MKETMSVESSLLRLPDELLLGILMACDPEDALRMAQVLFTALTDYTIHSYVNLAHIIDLQDSASLIRFKTSMDDPPCKVGL